MDRRKLPFNALRAFEAAARYASVTAAAKELGVTHSAISHQIKRLEEILGVALFQRTNRGLIITRDGAALLPTLSDSFDRIVATLNNIGNRDIAGAIQVTSTPTFASKWLLPRLSDWYTNPDASRIHLLPSLDLLDFKSGNIDFAIRCGIPSWPGLAHELLMPIDLIPVCSPDYAKRSRAPHTPEDLLEHNLIHADLGDHGLGEEWQDWLKGCGMKDEIKLQGLSFQDPALAMQAAADGLGVAIGYHQLIDHDLGSGKLVTFFNRTVRHRYAYYLVYDVNRKKDKPLQQFQRWITNQLSKSV
ncbi:MAG: LysR family glycine cleavage system transcriptional activator [Planctomycetota bacterium]|jgi:LysR family glycine cleavage system transcriptional activator